MIIGLSMIYMFNSSLVLANNEWFREQFIKRLKSMLIISTVYCVAPFGNRITRQDLIEDLSLIMSDSIYPIFMFFSL